MSQKTTGNRIQELRKKNGLTQQELADYLHIQRVKVAFLETDERKPNVDELVSIAKLFKVSCDYLLCQTEIPKGSADNDAIHRRLGLTLLAIKKLESWKRLFDENRNRTDIDTSIESLWAINYLIENNYGLLGDIVKYLFLKIVSEKTIHCEFYEASHEELKDKNFAPVRDTVFLSAETWVHMHLTAVQGHLTSLRNEIQANDFNPIERMDMVFGDTKIDEENNADVNKK